MVVKERGRGGGKVLGKKKTENQLFQAFSERQEKEKKSLPLFWRNITLEFV